ncbi:MAG: type II secretion system F family protein [Oligoflexales bacterium]|nr:type II secretion system F family protein [Oligoflexales bacterium]
MIENGISLLQALNLLCQQQKKYHFRKILEDVHASIEKGTNLSDSLEHHPDVFDKLFVSMVRAGEASGKLDFILKKLFEYIEKSSKIKSQIKSAMSYPIVILVVALGVVSALLTFVVPSFAEQFTESGKELPEITAFVVATSDTLIKNWHIILASGVVFFMSVKLWLSTAKGKYIFDKTLLKLPFFGDLVLKASIAKFSSTLSAMLSSGVSILDALSICASSVGNKEIEKVILFLKEEITKGKNLSEPMSQSKLFPLMVSSMVAVGETTGALDDTLAKVTSIYEDEVDSSIEALTSMIEPLMIVFIGTLIAFILIAMYLPIFDMGSIVGG